MLEANLHGDKSFCTLTYRFTQVTEDGLDTLDPAHTRDFLKRIRKAYEPQRLRYFLVGEYGDLSERPHYHVALFGHPPCREGKTRYSRKSDLPVCCQPCRLLHEKWALGRVDAGRIESASAQYIAGYTVKKMTSADDARLGTRYQEFARMSLKPGIGADFMHDVASTLLVHGLDQSEDDVPSSLRHGNKEMPLGRYLKGKLREAIGKENATPSAALSELQQEMRSVLISSIENKRSIAQEIVAQADPAVKRQEARARIYKKRGSI